MAFNGISNNALLTGFKRSRNRPRQRHNIIWIYTKEYIGLDDHDDDNLFVPIASKWQASGNYGDDDEWQ